jgi:N-acetylmuramoyl-L-alanine amidase
VIDVVYPAEGATLGRADSTFVFGSVGTGDASLTINGDPVEVAANGGWLAYLPIPADGVYNVAATARGETRTLTRRVVVPERAELRPEPGRVQILEGSVSPSGVLTRTRGEPIRVVGRENLTLFVEPAPARRT